MDARERVVAAARRLLGDAPVDSLLTFLTIEAIREEVATDGQGPAPSSKTISQLFSAPGLAGRFDRSVLIDAVLEGVVRDTETVAQANADGYLQAADTVRRGGGPEAVIAAIASDLLDYMPVGAMEVDARERAYYFCSTVADDARPLARRLRQFHGTAKDIYEGAYKAFLEVLNRRLATDVTYDQLYLAISGYLEGVQLYRRQGVAIDDDLIAMTVMRIFWAHTAPIAGTERNLVQELWRGVKPMRPSRGG